MAVRARAEENTPADVLKRYGDGDWPLRAVYNYGELANNGNYLEPQEISVRHGICGDPEQVKPRKTSRCACVFPPCFAVLRLTLKYYLPDFDQSRRTSIVRVELS